jgi:hypothetical protein
MDAVNFAATPVFLAALTVPGDAPLLTPPTTTTTTTTTTTDAMTATATTTTSTLSMSMAMTTTAAAAASAALPQIVLRLALPVYATSTEEATLFLKDAFALLNREAEKVVRVHFKAVIACRCGS